MDTVLGTPFQLLVNVNIESAVNMQFTHAQKSSNNLILVVTVTSLY